MALQADAMLDLIALTQRDLGPNKFTDISYNLQEHVILPRLLRKESVTYGSGTGKQFNILHGTSGQAQMGGLFQQLEYDQADIMTQGYVPWRHPLTKYVIEERQIAMNREPARIVELLKVVRHDAMVSLAGLLETQAWSKPADSTDTEDIFGIPYWIVKGSQGFNGTNPSGFTDGAAGVSSTTYPNWANWCDDFEQVSEADLLVKWRLASYKTNFKPPVKHPNYETGMRYGYYTNYDNYAELVQLLRSMNDNITDLAKFDGEVNYRRVPVTVVPNLDSDTTDPIYGIDWGVFKFTFLKGEYMKEVGPIRLPYQPRTIATTIWLSMNAICHDRRRLFVISKNA